MVLAAIFTRRARCRLGQGSALLFEMNALFEEYIGRLVTRALRGPNSA